MLRIWILVSVAWIMGWIIYMIIGALKGEITMTGDILVVPVILFGPPIALLIFGAATGWAFRGFDADDHPPSRGTLLRPVCCLPWLSVCSPPEA